MPVKAKARPTKRKEIQDGEALYIEMDPDEYLVYHAQHVAGMDSLGTTRLVKNDDAYFIKGAGWLGNFTKGSCWIAMHKGQCYGVGPSKEIAVAILVEASKRNLLPL